MEEQLRLTFGQAVERIRAQLGPLVADIGITPADIRADSSLIDDLALDSLKFVDLTLALEQSFGIDEFPMQEWIDFEATKNESFTVSALAAACLRIHRGHPAFE